jgi:hypothetical protein
MKHAALSTRTRCIVIRHSGQLSVRPVSSASGLPSDVKKPTSASVLSKTETIRREASMSAKTPPHFSHRRTLGTPAIPSSDSRHRGQAPAGLGPCR